MDTSELETIRHDLRNVVTALESGCLLIGSRLGSDADPELAAYLEEMRHRLAEAERLLDRLAEAGPDLGATVEDEG